jgi:glycogen operon protein
VRDFWRGEPRTVDELATRLTGSSDLYQDDTRRPHASINFVTAHDGFTLRDLVSYNHKHNEVNGDDNTDGENHNRSWNCGVEGLTTDPVVLHLRARQQRNVLTTLFLSQGVPMLLGGDEIGRTQHGNNNGYCQDNPISWFDWDEIDHHLLDFTRKLIAFRRSHPVFRRRRFFQGRPIRGTVDIGWCRPDGGEMTDADWNAGEVRSVGMFVNGDAIPSRDARGQKVVDDSFLVMFNGGPDPIEWALPHQWGKRWELAISTVSEPAPGASHQYELGDSIAVPGRSVIVLRRTENDDRER